MKIVVSVTVVAVVIFGVELGLDVEAMAPWVEQVFTAVGFWVVNMALFYWYFAPTAVRLHLCAGTSPFSVALRRPTRSSPRFPLAAVLHPQRLHAGQKPRAGQSGPGEGRGGRQGRHRRD